MATAPALRKPEPIWHVRGSWSPREDRIAFAAWLGVLWVGMIAGFSVDVPRYLQENPSAPKVTYFHGAVFTGWILIVTVQVLLVLKERVAWHRKFGWFAAAWACLMAVMGPWAALASDAVNLHQPVGDTAFLSVQIVDLGGFLLLLACGIALRRNPAAHKRIMILATVSLADPGFARFSQWLWPTGPNSVLPWFFWIFYGNVLLVALMVGWDWWRGRLMPQLVAGAAGLLAGEYVATLLYFWGPWKALTLNWVEAWAKLN
jgi:hypothetical protein